MMTLTTDFHLMAPPSQTLMASKVIMLFWIKQERERPGRLIC